MQWKIKNSCVMDINFQVLLVEGVHYRHMAKETNGSLFSCVGL